MLETIVKIQSQIFHVTDFVSVTHHMDTHHGSLACVVFKHRRFLRYFKIFQLQFSITQWIRIIVELVKGSDDHLAGTFHLSQTLQWQKLVVNIILPKEN